MKPFQTENKDLTLKEIDKHLTNAINDLEELNLNDFKKFKVTSKVMNNAKTKETRKWIYDTKCKCTYECAMSTNALFSWPMTKKYFGLILGKNKI